MIIDGWYCCSCGQKLFKVSKDAIAKGIQFKCKKCKKINEIEIEPVSLSKK